MIDNQGTNLKSDINDTGLMYNDLIDDYKFSYPCPDHDCRPQNLKAFRWVIDNPAQEDSYLPTKLFAEKKGVRLPVPRGNTQEDLEFYHCRICSISLFTTENQARSAYNNISGAVKSKWGYNHVAYADITDKDGLSSSPTRNGHFSFFQYNSINLSTKFSVVGSL